MHAPLSHGENALDKGRGDHIMATVRSISESRVIQLSIFSDTRNDRVYAFLDVDSRKKSVNKFGQFNFVVCFNLQYPILPVLILKPNKIFGSRSEEHTSELQSLMRISYAVFCLKKKRNITYTTVSTDNIILQKTIK